MVGFIVYSVLILAALLYALVQPHLFPAWPTRRMPWLSLAVWGLNAAVFAVTLARTRHSLPTLPTRGPLDVTLADRGLIVGAAGKSRCVAWRLIQCAWDVEHALVISDIAGGVLVIPKRVFPDAGADWWAALDDRLVGKRNLVRPAGPRRLIVNSRNPAA